MEKSLRSPVILEAVFKNLPAKELNTCAQVCSAWNQVAEIIKKRRTRCLNWYFCNNCEEHAGYCEADFSNFLNNLYCEPKFGFIFITKKKANIERPRPKRSAAKRAKLNQDSQIFVKALASPCNYIFCIAPGITGTTSDKSISEELERDRFGIAAAYFPNFPGVKINKFKILDLKKKNKNDLNIPSHESLKCLLLFMSSIRSSKEEIALSSYVNQKEVTFGVGGARITKVLSNDIGGLKSDQGSFALAFTGSNVRSVSIVIPAEVETAEEVEIELRKFIETDILNGQCIAFSFTCIARGEQMYEKPNVECNVFRKLFPHIPLLGVFANGEIGYTYLPGVPKAPPLVMIPEEKQIFHFYSTIFVVIAITT